MLAEQERVLFKLLFNEGARAQWMANGSEWLMGQGLSADDVNDFATVEPKALQKEARFRRSMIIAELTKKMPLSAVAWSSIYGGQEEFFRLFDDTLCALGGYARCVEWADRLYNTLLSDTSVQGRVRQWGLACMSLERDRMKGLNTCFQLCRDGEWFELMHSNVSYTRPLHWYTGVSYGVLPVSEKTLMAECVPSTDSLWADFQHKQPNHRVFDECTTEPVVNISRPQVNVVSRTDPMLGMQSIEVSIGFLEMFRGVDQGASLRDIEGSLIHAGADANTVKGILGTFAQLIEQGYIGYGE